MPGFAGPWAPSVRRTVARLRTLRTLGKVHAVSHNACRRIHANPHRSRTTFRMTHHEGLFEQLRRLGPEGTRAAEMLMAAEEQIDRSGVRAGNLIAFCTREALMSLLDLGGRRKRNTGDAAREVVQCARRVRDQRASQETLLEAAQKLEAALEGPGPHSERLERVITTLARRAPVRAQADLLDAYIDALAALNDALHGDVAVVTAVELHTNALATVGRLFGPMAPRLAEIDALVALADPTELDVARLASLAGDPRVVDYFFARIGDPAWLRALWDDALLMPPGEGIWPAFPYLTALAKSHPDEVRSWLESRPGGGDLTDNQAYLMLTVARTVRDGVANAVVRLVETHTTDAGVLHGIAGYLEALPQDEHSSGAVTELLKRALDGVLGGGSPADDSYLAAGMLRVAVSSATRADPGRWLRILAAKLASVADPPNAFQFRRLEAIGGLALEAGAPVLQLLVVAIRDVANLAADAGVPAEQRISALEKVPPPLAGRLVALHLNERADIDAVAALRLLTNEVAEHVPMPETLALLRSLTDRGVPELEPQMLEALGDPPTAEEIAALSDEDELPASWRRAYGWLDAMPQGVKVAWAAANEKVEARWGKALPEGHIIPRATAEWVSVTSPSEPDELARMTPLEAAAHVAAWRPETDQYGGPTAHGLADALRKTIEANPERWLAESPSDVIRALRHPTYITEYFQALAEHAGDIVGLVTPLVDAVELVQGEPWPVSDLGGDDYDQHVSWARASDLGVELIGRLASAGADFSADRDRAWQLIERAARDRDEAPVFAEDQEARPLDHAVNRRSMRSLSVAIAFAEATSDPDREPEQLLDLLDEVLNLHRPDGLHARAMLARPLPWLVHHAPIWVAGNWQRIVGDEAPDGLGPDTFDLYLEWGEPYGPILEENRDRYGAAMLTVPEHARRHILTAMLWGLDGYAPASVLAMIRRGGDQQVSEAAEWLAFSASRSEEMPLDAAVEFWRLALAEQLPPESYEGFGWLANVSQLDQDTWLDLMLAAANAAKGQLEQANHLATRASEHPEDERAIRLVSALLGADLKLWYLEDVGGVGLALLKSDNPATERARSELRERLLERGFFDAHEGQ